MPSRYGDAIASGAGVAEVTFGPVPVGHEWAIERIAITTTSAALSAADVYVGDALDINLVDHTDAGNDDVADEGQKVIVPESKVLRVRWTGMTAASKATARVQFDQRRAGALAK